MDKKSLGLYDKFKVTRTDNKGESGGEHENCQYFVLDTTHDPHARAALLAYANSCEPDGYVTLANHLRELVAKTPSAVNDTQYEKFLKLKTAWQNEIQFESNGRKIVTSYSYLRIVGMGDVAVDYIIRDLKENGDEWWDYALHLITGVNPVKEENAGNLKEICKDWLEALHKLGRH